MKDQENRKVQLIFAPKAFASLKRLKTRVGATSQADAVRYAIDLVLFIADGVDQGSTLYWQTKEKEIERIFLPFLGREANVSEDADSSG